MSHTLRHMALLGLCLTVLLAAPQALAGDLNPPAAPTDPGSALYTIEDIYKRLQDGTAGSKRVGGFAEPAAGPTAGTGRTLNEVMGVAPVVDDADGAGAGDVLSGKTFWGLSSGAWGTRNGSMANVGKQDITPGTSAQTITQGYHDGTGSVAGNANLVSGNIRSGVTIFGVAGDANVVNTTSGDAAASDLLAGKKAWVDGNEVTGSATAGANVNGADGARTITIPDGLYSAGKTATANDADLVAGNIKKGVGIFGVTGTLDPDAISCSGTRWSNTAQDTAGRWCDNGNGTVTDLFGHNGKGKGLVWLKNAGWGSYRTWNDAHTRAGILKSGDAGLADSSVAGDWRLPTLEELKALTQGTHQIRSGTPGPFSNVQPSIYWSSSTYASYTDAAWIVFLNTGPVSQREKTETYYVWPVRGRQ